MKCPHCNIPLMMTERRGVEIDFCTQCRGIWLDRGELDKIIELSVEEQAQSVVDDDPGNPFEIEGQARRHAAVTASHIGVQASGNARDTYQAHYVGGDHLSQTAREQHYQPAREQPRYDAGGHQHVHHHHYKHKRKKGLLRELLDIFD